MLLLTTRMMIGMMGRSAEEGVACLRDVQDQS